MVKILILVQLLLSIQSVSGFQCVVQLPLLCPPSVQGGDRRVVKEVQNLLRSIVP